MFIAIINKAYEEVNQEEHLTHESMKKERRLRKILYNETEPKTWWEWCYDKMKLVKAAFTTTRQESLIDIVESGQIDDDKDGRLTKEELRAHLPPEIDVDALMMTYDHDNSGCLEVNEVLLWLEDLRQQKADVEDHISLIVENGPSGSDDEVPAEDYRGVHKRVLTYFNRVQSHIPGESPLMNLHYKPPEKRKKTRAVPHSTDPWGLTHSPNLRAMLADKSTSKDMDALIDVVKKMAGSLDEFCARANPRSDDVYECSLRVEELDSKQDIIIQQLSLLTSQIAELTHKPRSIALASPRETESDFSESYATESTLSSPMPRIRPSSSARSFMR